MIKPGVSKLQTLDVEATTRHAKETGYFPFVLPSNGVNDRVTFFEAVRATLPLDPPLVRNDSWDALSDSLWEGLHEHPGDKIVIIWPDTHLMAHSAPSDFDTAVRVIADVIEGLADAAATLGKVKQVALVMS